MTVCRPLSLPAWLPHAQAAMLADGVRHHTPCGDGWMVWHSWGDPRQPTLVLLHGGSGSWTHWLRNIGPLRQAGWHVLAPDLPGMGDSYLPDGCIDTDDLPPWLHLGLRQIVPHVDVQLVGFSFGGMTAALWLQSHPGDARALVLVGAPGLGLHAPQLTPLKGWRHLSSEQARDEVHRHNLQVLMLHHPLAIDATALALHRDNVERDRMPRRRLSRTDILARALPQLQVPVSAIFGQHDALYRHRLAEVEGLLRQRCTRWGLWTQLADVGHWAQYEAPGAFHQALLDSLVQPLSAETAARNPSR